MEFVKGLPEVTKFWLYLSDFFLLLDESNYNITCKDKFTNNIIQSSTFTPKPRENNAEQLGVSDGVSRPVGCDGVKPLR
jgi:hypothetical protein